MIVIKNAKIGKSGRHSYITVPKSYVDNEIIDPNKTYDVILKEVRKNKKEDEFNKEMEVTSQ